MRPFRPAIAAALLAFSGCFFGDGQRSRVETVPPELQRPRVVAPKAPDRHPYGEISKLRVGQWATYRVGASSLTLSAVAAEGDSMWIEVVEEGDPRQVSARLVAPGGVVRKAFYAELGKDGSRSPVEPQPLGQGGPDPASRGTESGRQVSDDTVTVAGRPLKVRRVELRFEDLEGRLTREVTLWSPEAPALYAGSADGGLVRREGGGAGVELTAFGNDARPLLDPPK